MRITVDVPDSILPEIETVADEEEFGNRSVVVKKALVFFLAHKAKKRQETEKQNNIDSKTNSEES